MKSIDDCTGLFERVDIDADQFAKKMPETIDPFLPLALTEVLSSLKEQEIFVLTHRFGLGGNAVLTLKECGKLRNVGPERIRQLECTALRKLRHPARAQLLAPFMADLPIGNNKNMFD